MFVSEEIRKCVCFVGLERADRQTRFIGTAFLMGRETPQQPGSSFTYIVTAKHVIQAIKTRGLDRVHLRVNTTDGASAWLITKLEEWHLHPDPTVDVAVMRGGPEGSDHLFLQTTMALAPGQFGEHGIGIGTETLIVGLFANHVGERRNIPIIRVGNIAALPEEPVVTENGPMEAILIEARSIGGLSGSPVFAHLGNVRVFGGQLQTADKPVLRLIGLVHGHWDIKVNVDEQEDVGANIAHVNMGIGIVIPVTKILDVLDSPAIAGAEAQLSAQPSDGSDVKPS